jgi:HEAT repeat protein
MRWYAVRACATWGIARLQYRPAAPFLIEALERCVVLPRRSEAEACEARRYIRALRSVGAQEALPILIRTALGAVGLRSTAVQALVELGPEQAAPALVGLLSDPGQRLRRQLLRLMVKAGSHALPAIRDLLHADRHDVRLSALRALGRLQDPDAVPELALLEAAPSD